MSRSWDDHTLSAHFPNLTHITVRTDSQLRSLLDELHADPGALAGVRVLRLIQDDLSTFKARAIEGRPGHYSYRYERPGAMEEELLEELLRTPWASRLDTLHIHLTRLTSGAPGPLVRALAEVPFERLSTLEIRYSKQAPPGGPRAEDAFAALGKAPWMKGLHHLTLRGRWLHAEEWASLLEELGRPAHLHSLDLSETIACSRGIGDTFTRRGWYALTSLALDGCTLSDADVRAMASTKDMFSLKSLSLDGVTLTDTGASSLGASYLLARLEELSLTTRGLTSRGLGAILKSPRLGGLRRLTLRHLGGPAGAELAVILARAAALDELEELELQDTRLGDPGAIMVLGSMKTEALTRLSLQGNALSADAMRALVDAKFVRALRHLDLSRNALGDEGAALVSALPTRLRYADLSRNGIGDQGLEAIVRGEAFGLVETLLLEDNDWTHSGAVVLKERPELERLHTLNLRDNELGGVENIMTAMMSPAGLHLHRPQIDWEGLDLAQDEMEQVYEDVRDRKRDDEGRVNNVDGSSQAFMRILARFATIPGLSERFAGSSYLSASMRRDLHRIAVRVENYMAGGEAQRFVPDVVCSIAVSYTRSIKNINDAHRIPRTLPDPEEAWLRWKNGWFEFRED